MEIASLTHCLPALILFYLYNGTQATVPLMMMMMMMLT